MSLLGINSEVFCLFGCVCCVSVGNGDNDVFEDDPDDEEESEEQMSGGFRCCWQFHHS